MSFANEAFHRVVSNMIARFGADSTLEIEGEGVYDPSTSSYTASTLEYTIQAMIFDRTLQSNGLSTLPNSLIQDGDKQVYIQPLNKTDPNLVMPEVRPNRDKFVSGDGVRYSIVTYKQINPTRGDNILIELFVRQESDG